MDWAGEQYEVDFLKKLLVVGGSIFWKLFLFHEWGRHGRSGRENSGKIIAAAFSRRDFLIDLGRGGWRSGGELRGVIPHCLGSTPV